MPKRTTIDILHDMQDDDARVKRDAQILDKLRSSVRPNLLPSRSGRGPLKNQPLYSRYTGTGFPLRKPNGRKLPGWKHLTPWLRLQIALLVLGERNYRPFKIQLHDDLRDKLEREGKDQREYIRDRMRRRLKARFGNPVPMFFFVVEDMDDAGNQVRPHAHGVIEIRPYPIDSVSDARAQRLMRKIEATHDQQVAEIEAGRWAIRLDLRRAAGLTKGRGKTSVSGVNQFRNIWLSKPMQPIFNHQWVTYISKNAAEHSPVLGANRLALPYELLGEAKRLWSIIRG